MTRGHKQFRQILDHCTTHGLQATYKSWYQISYGVRKLGEVDIYGSADELLAVAQWYNTRFTDLHLDEGDIRAVSPPTRSEHELG